MDAIQHSEMSALPRLGGEMPAGADRFRDEREWQPDWLAFSHGRAALGWLIGRTKATRAVCCAYTCPSVPQFLHGTGLPVTFFDAGAPLATLEEIAREQRGRTLVLVPSLFGSPPWIAAHALAERLGRTAVVVVDAAQTAFGHCDLRPPPGGATLSCPRKTTSLPDGAVLALGGGLKAAGGIGRRPVAEQALVCKQAARALWATRDPALEDEAVDLNRRAEQGWPDAPHRMSDTSRLLLERMDADWHRKIRRRNRAFLAGALRGHVPMWAADRGTPFSLPVFVREPDALIARLRERRIFTSRLWPDAEHDPRLHPAAAWLVRHLVSLPVDQRHSDDDMLRVAEGVAGAKPAPAPAPPPALRGMVEV